MCEVNIPSYKEPPPVYGCAAVRGPACLPCGGVDSITLRRPLVVGDSTFEYRPTARPAHLLNMQDKKVRYQLINCETQVTPRGPYCLC